MIVYHMRHAWSMLWQDKFFTIISLLGIGLAVSFIMVILTVNEIDDASYAPEVNRYRTLYVKNTIVDRGENQKSCSYLSPKLVKTVFYDLKKPEAVTALARDYSIVEPKSMSGKGENVNTISTDAAYWKFFEFEFLEGKPFVQSDFNSGIKVAVICQSLSRSLYNGSAAVGKDIYIGQQRYRVVGVVRDVSQSGTFSYAKVWLPYSSDSRVVPFKEELASGPLHVLIMAKRPSDFKDIIKEVERNRARYNLPIIKQAKIMLGGPDTHSEQRCRKWSSQEENGYKENLLLWLTILIILMVVPAFNMSSFTISRMRKRQEELGLRRTFGARRSDIIGQVISENMVLTLIGGLLGFALSIILLLCLQEMLFPDGVSYSISMFLKPAVLAYLTVICLAINLISAIIPAVKLARQPIVLALKEKKS